MSDTKSDTKSDTRSETKAEAKAEKVNETETEARAEKASETETEAIGPVLHTDTADTDSGRDPDTASEDTGEAGPRTGRRRRLAAGVTVLGVLLALLGGLLLHQAHTLRDSAAARNHALTDAAATARVNGDVSSALAKVFSYTPDGTEATERSARATLSGRAARQYAQLFARVRADVRDQKVTLSTQAVRVGTVSLRGRTAHLLVFLDQTARRGTKKPTTSAAQLSVTAELRADVWRIVDIKAR